MYHSGRVSYDKDYKRVSHGQYKNGHKNYRATWNTSMFVLFNKNYIQSFKGN